MIRKIPYSTRIAFLAICLLPFGSESNAQFSEVDRQALTALYHATGGDNWNDNTNWLTDDIDTWYGIEAYEFKERRVYSIELPGNNLIGEIPPEMSALEQVRTLDLSDNYLTGDIPTELGIMINLISLDLSNNLLTGNLPVLLGHRWGLHSLNVQNNSDLSGTLPFDFNRLDRLDRLWFDGTSLCEPMSAEFQLWIGGIVDVRRSGCTVETSESSIGTCEDSLGEAYLDVNNVRARIPNTGSLFYRGEPHVYEVPRSSGSNAIFAGSIWIAGIGDGSLRLSAAKYRDWEMWAGPLDDDGKPPLDCVPYDHVYSVRESDITEFETTGRPTYDLLNWPSGLGAPTLDKNGNEIDLSGQPLSVRKERVIDLASGERPRLRGGPVVVVGFERPGKRAQVYRDGPIRHRNAWQCIRQFQFHGRY